MHVPLGSGPQGQLVGRGEARRVGGTRLSAAHVRLKMALRLGELREEELLYLPSTLTRLSNNERMAVRTEAPTTGAWVKALDLMEARRWALLEL